METNPRAEKYSRSCNLESQLHGPSKKVCHECIYGHGRAVCAQNREARKQKECWDRFASCRHGRGGSRKDRACSEQKEPVGLLASARENIRIIPWCRNSCAPGLQ